MEQDIEDLHRSACDQGLSTYTDPATGYQVFTALALRERGKCCGCGCRHCAEAFPETGLAAAKAKAGCAESPKMLYGSEVDLDDDVVILFWSGGKDSYLALREIARHTGSRSSILLLTTYDARTQTVAHQEIHIDVVKKQAQALQIGLLGVPLCGAVGDYVWHIKRAVEKVTAFGIKIRHLAFGDLHLAHVRAWRDSNLAHVLPDSAGCASKAMGLLWYPLWQRQYSDLMQELQDSGVIVRISAVLRSPAGSIGVDVGDTFDSLLVKRLPPDVDQFGEDGEFHTVVDIPSSGGDALPWGGDENSFAWRECV